jgi:ribosomal protein L24
MNMVDKDGAPVSEGDKVIVLGDDHLRGKAGTVTWIKEKNGKIVANISVPVADGAAIYGVWLDSDDFVLERDDEDGKIDNP